MAAGDSVLVARNQGATSSALTRGNGDVCRLDRSKGQNAVKLEVLPVGSGPFDYDIQVVDSALESGGFNNVTDSAGTQNAQSGYIKKDIGGVLEYADVLLTVRSGTLNVRLTPFIMPSNDTVTAQISGSVNVGNFPSSQAVTGTVTANVGTTPTGTSAEEVQGTAAAGSPPVGNPVLVAGSDGTDVRTIATDTDGTVKTDGSGHTQPVSGTVSNAPLDGAKATYSATILGLVPAGTPTDVFTLTGSGTKTVRITRVKVSGTQTTGGVVDVQQIVRSTADTLGTSTTPTAVPHDSSSAAATAVARAYTANPTLGTAVGPIRADKLWVAATTAQPTILDDRYGDRPAQAVVLRGTAQQWALNLNGVTLTGGSLDISVEWTEE